MPVKFTDSLPSETLREYRAKRPLRSFPATSTEAAYYPGTQHIEMCQVDLALWHKAGNSNDAAIKLRVLPTLLHEHRHWLDHVGSLWGQRNLIARFNAVHSRIKNNESEFWRIIDYLKASDRDRYKRYFTTIGDPRPPPNGDRRWIAELTCGIGFDENGRPDNQRPILFARFLWNDRRRACRVPLSIGSLLETNAMQYEIATEQELLTLLADDSRHVETAERKRSHLERVYNPELGIYSAAVHVVANHLKISDIFRAYEVASLLAALSLNLPDKLFSKLRTPDSFETWGPRVELLRQARDRGFAFLALVHNAPLPWPDEQLDVWCDRALLESNLPPLAEFSRDVLDEMDLIKSSALPGTHASRLHRMLDAGRGLAERMGPLFKIGEFHNALPQLDPPPVLFNDLRIGHLGPPRLEDLDAQFSEFLDACGLLG